MSNKKNSLLWSFQYPSSKKTSYLFGTMHVRDYRAFHWLDHLQELILSCDVYAGESNIDALQGQTSHMQLSADLSIPKLISEKKYQKLRKILNSSFAVDIDHCRQLYPIIIVNMLAERILYNSQSISLDARLWNYAKSNEKKLVGLESADKQIEIFKSIPLDHQIKSLRSIGKNPGKFRKSILSLINQYEKQEIKKLYKASKRSLGSIRSLLLYDRNKNMADAIVRYGEESTYFIAIGAAHLYGEKGVLRLLKKQGYKVKPIELQVVTA